jgi:hypothetical protein
MWKKLARIFAALVLVAGAVAVSPGTAEARPRARVYVEYWGPGIYFGFGQPWPYYYGPYYYRPYYYRPYYYGPGNCGYVRVRVGRRGHRVWIRAWRCW